MVAFKILAQVQVHFIRRSCVEERGRDAPEVILSVRKPLDIDPEAYLTACLLIRVHFSLVF